MKTVLLILSLVALPASAHAIQRYNIGSMSCARVHAILHREKAAILRHRSPRTGITLYDRYVQDGRFCSSYDVEVRDYLPTADNPSCEVFHCKPAEDYPGFAGFD